MCVPNMSGASVMRLVKKILKYCVLPDYVEKKISRLVWRNI